MMNWGSVFPANPSFVYLQGHKVVPYGRMSHGKGTYCLYMACKTNNFSVTPSIESLAPLIPSKPNF